MENYSVLMSVYKKEMPSNLKEALESIFHQTLKSNDVVVVCDGELNQELNEVLDIFKNSYPELNIIRKSENTGLGDSLAIGLLHCKNNIIMRADSDDISLLDRAEVEIEFMHNNNLDIVSSNVDLFSESVDKIIGSRIVPLSHKEIVSFSKSRSPFNHPAVMFKKNIVLRAGNYRNLRNKQDYDLWVRCIQVGAKCSNINKSLVYMRTCDDLVNRRRSKTAYQCSKEIFKYMKETKYISKGRYWLNRFIYAAQYYSPKFISVFVYRLLHKKHH